MMRKTKKVTMQNNIPFLLFRSLSTEYKFCPLQFIQSTSHYCKVTEGTDAGMLKATWCKHLFKVIQCTLFLKNSMMQMQIWMPAIICLLYRIK